MFLIVDLLYCRSSKTEKGEEREILFLIAFRDIRNILKMNKIIFSKIKGWSLISPLRIINLMFTQKILKNGDKDGNSQNFLRQIHKIFLPLGFKIFRYI
jgi:hypothetical protein